MARRDRASRLHRFLPPILLALGGVPKNLRLEIWIDVHLAQVVWRPRLGWRRGSAMRKLASAHRAIVPAKSNEVRVRVHAASGNLAADVALHGFAVIGAVAIILGEVS